EPAPPSGRPVSAIVARARPNVPLLGSVSISTTSPKSGRETYARRPLGLRAKCAHETRAGWAGWAWRRNGRKGSKLMRTNPWAPTAKAVLASGDSATSVGGNPVATAAPLGEGAATVEVRSVNENRLLGVGTPA